MTMIEEMMLEVLDAPKSVRIIIDTNLPALSNNISDTIEELGNGEKISDTLYYMIDRSPDQGETVSDVWYVSNSCGGGIEIPSHAILIGFIKRITDHCKDAKIWIESY